MDPFTRLTAKVAPLPAANVDTDIIFPARFLTITTKTGLGPWAFHDWRFTAEGAPVPDFVLNLPAYAGAEILVAGDNFGCGSSREQAPWALKDLGFRCVISTGFGEIFQANCFKNGLLPIVLPTGEHADLMADAEEGAVLTVDLERQLIVNPAGAAIAFAVEPWRREALLNGWDEIAIVLNAHAQEITAFEARRRAEAPWLFEETPTHG
jgi:3-isopropylmalate dehydratase small subunit